MGDPNKPQDPTKPHEPQKPRPQSPNDEDNR